MRLLWLGTSDDFNEVIPEDARTPTVAARIIEERTGLKPEFVSKALYPTRNMAELAANWIDECDPEMVFLSIGSYWYSYRSVPLRMQRRLGLLGRPLAGAGRKAAESRAVVESRLFHLVRKLALNTIGGDVQFTPDEVFERVEATIRRVVAKEDCVLTVRGPTHRYDRKPLRGHPTHLAMTKRLKRLCSDLHVAFVGWDEPPFDANQPDGLLGDRLHFDESGHAFLGSEIGEALAAAWLAAHPAGATQ